MALRTYLPVLFEGMPLRRKEEWISLCPSHSFLFFASWSVVFQLLAAYSQRWRKKMESNLLFEVLEELLNFLPFIVIYV